MAKMIPAQYDVSTVSNAERRIFDLLKSDSDTNSWTVIHSLGLARRGRKPYGEIDFVVLIPGSGILCLEVKGGRVACKDGVWTTTNREGKTFEMNRSPFMQAMEGMQSVRKAVEEKFGPGHAAATTVFGRGVILPDVQMPVEPFEWEKWEGIALDPYWTLMAYFNSLRELGHAATLIRADIRDYLNAMWDRLNIRRPEPGTDGVDGRRFINRDLELTSRIQSSAITEVLQQLFNPYPGGENRRPVDVCLATNMIQVGLDVPRLGLMTVVGQPKTTSNTFRPPAGSDAVPPVPVWSSRSITPPSRATVHTTNISEPITRAFIAGSSQPALLPLLHRCVSVRFMLRS